MYKIIYVDKDATIYSEYPTMNTGGDNVLELIKIAKGDEVTVSDPTLTAENNFGVGVGGNGFVEYTHSRILLDFDITEVSQSISDGDITNPKFYLVLKAQDAFNTPSEYSLRIFPMSASWTGGTGYYDKDVFYDEGVSWFYRHGAFDNTRWTSNGGDYLLEFEAEIILEMGDIVQITTYIDYYDDIQTFNNELPNVRMDISKTVNTWIEGWAPKYGIILKYPKVFEFSSITSKYIRFYSSNSKTIYSPRVEVFWDDTDLSGTNSISEISGEYTVVIKNLRGEYSNNELVKLRLSILSDDNPGYSLTTNSFTQYRLPTTSYFQIMDYVTDEVIVPFNDPGTKISCDASGNYFRLDTKSLLPERTYKIILKVVNGSDVQYIDNNFKFSVK
jgi:hypothetical protein